MKKRIFSLMLLTTLLVPSFYSCTDDDTKYDEEITKLDERLGKIEQEQKAALEKLQQELDELKASSGVTTTALAELITKFAVIQSTYANKEDLANLRAELTEKVGECIEALDTKVDVSIYESLVTTVNTLATTVEEGDNANAEAIKTLRAELLSELNNRLVTADEIERQRIIKAIEDLTKLIEDTEVDLNMFYYGSFKYVFEYDKNKQSSIPFENATINKNAKALYSFCTAEGVDKTEDFFIIDSEGKICIDEVAKVGEYSFYVKAIDGYNKHIATETDKNYLLSPKAFNIKINADLGAKVEGTNNFTFKEADSNFPTKKQTIKIVPTKGYKFDTDVKPNIKYGSDFDCSDAFDKDGNYILTLNSVSKVNYKESDYKIEVTNLKEKGDNNNVQTKPVSLTAKVTRPDLTDFEMESTEIIRYNYNGTLYPGRESLNVHFINARAVATYRIGEVSLNSDVKEGLFQIDPNTGKLGAKDETAIPVGEYKIQVFADNANGTILDSKECTTTVTVTPIKTRETSIWIEYSKDVASNIRSIKVADGDDPNFLIRIKDGSNEKNIGLDASGLTIPKGTINDVKVTLEVFFNENGYKKVVDTKEISFHITETGKE